MRFKWGYVQMRFKWGYNNWVNNYNKGLKVSFLNSRVNIIYYKTLYLDILY